MTAQMRVLLRLKTLKEKEQLRAVHRKRQEVADATVLEEDAGDRVETSAKTLRSREDAIYDGILGRVVSLADIDDTKAKVVELEKGHGRLVDELERCRHVKTRLEKELDASVALHRQALRNVDKYVLITDELARQTQEIADGREETEIEDLFAKRRKEAP